MKQGFLSQYFTGVVAKRLSAVEANPQKSHQHEFNGIKLLKKILGDSGPKYLETRYIWFGKENEGITEEGTTTWYDARRDHPTRTEFRLYFESNLVTSLAEKGDLIFFALNTDGTLIVIVASAQSTFENQLLWLFGLSFDIGFQFEGKEISSEQDTQLDFATRYILDELGIEIEEPDASYLDSIISKYGVKGFPGTVFPRDPSN